MYLGAYRFTGNTADLLESYATLRASYPDDALHLHICAVGDDGIVVLDACPDRHTFEHFSVSEEFRSLVAASGLPTPTVQGLGEVHHAFLRQAVAR